MSSYARSTTFQGDIDLVPAGYAADGTGNLNVANVATVKGAVASTSPTTGALVVSQGGLGVNGDTYVANTLNVAGKSNLNFTSVNTTGNAMSITGMGASSGLTAQTDGPISFASTTAAISVAAAASSLITTSSGNLSVLANLGSAIIGSGAASSSAVQLNASNANGGVTVTAGTGGVSLVGTGASGFALNSDANADLLIRRYGSTTTANTSAITLSNERGTSGTAVNIRSTVGGITNTAATNWSTSVTGGAFSLTGNNATSTVGLTSTGNGQNLVMQLTGATNSSLLLSSATTPDNAIALASSVGGITMNAVTRLKQVVSGGPLDFSSILAAGSAGSSIYTTAAAGSQDFNIGLKVVSANNSRMILTGQGSGTDSILFNSPTAGITASSATGFYSTSTAGPFVFSGAGGSAGPSLSYASMSDAVDYTLQLTGAQKSRLRLLSSGTTAQAVDIESSAGGIFASAAGLVSLQSSDTTNGIQIGTTTQNVPVTIGNGIASTVTIGQNLVVNGSFTVSGPVTSINSTTLSTGDNMIVLNSGPTGTSNAGLVTKRYQTPTGGDVVLDVPNSTGTIRSATASTVTLASTESAIVNYYAGFWIKVTYASNSTSVFAQIKSYDATGKVVTLVDGQTFATVPGSSDSYSLYGHNYACSYYNEFSDVWDIAYTNSDPTANSTLTVTGRPGVVMGQLSLDKSLKSDVISRNATGYVTVEGVSFASGAITGVVTLNGNKPDITAQYTLADVQGVTAGTLISAITKPGPYTVTVNDTADGGANAIFFLSKSAAGNVGTVDRIVASSGANNQRVDLVWNASEAPRIYYMVAPGDGSTRTYSIRINTV